MDQEDRQGNVYILEGLLPDQAALAGLLNTIYELRFALVSVDPVGEPDDS